MIIYKGVLPECSNSVWATSTFIIPKINGAVRFISDKCLIRRPYPIPKIVDAL